LVKVGYRRKVEVHLVNPQLGEGLVLVPQGLQAMLEA